MAGPLFGQLMAVGVNPALPIATPMHFYQYGVGAGIRPPANIRHCLMLGERPRQGTNIKSASAERLAVVPRGCSVPVYF